LILSVLVLGIAAYEVIYENAWAGFEYLGCRLFRASSTMFNPNVLGLWGAMLVFLGQYLQKERESNKTSYGLLILGVIVIFLSGSRTALLFCGVILYLEGCLKLYVGHTYKKSFQYGVFFTLAFTLVCLISYLFISSACQPLHLLAERFLSFPHLLYSIVAGSDLTQSEQAVLDGRIGVPNGVGLDGTVGVPNGVGIYEIYDNGYLALMANSFGALFVWSLMVLYFLSVGVKKFFGCKNDQAVFAFTSLIGFIVIGLFIRAYQVFPVWGLSSLMLGVFIAWMVSDDKVSSEKIL